MNAKSTHLKIISLFTKYSLLGAL